MSTININQPKLQIDKSDLERERIHIKSGIFIAAAFIGLITILFIVQQFFGAKFCPGIKPQEITGLWGIWLYPFFHSNATHLLSNAPPLFLLILGMYYYFPKKLLPALLSIWLISALFIWGFGRPGCHLGASGIVYGLAFFLSAMGFFKKQRNLGAFALIIVFLYGSMVWGVLPQESGISWEGHAGGAATGLLLAFLWKNTPVYTSIYDPIIDDDQHADADDDGDEDTKSINDSSEQKSTILYHFKPDHKT